jgi:predicted PurR-regulated permease PerM
MPNASPPLRYAIAAWVIAGCLLVLVLYLRLLPALLAGLLVYELVHQIAPRIPLMRRAGGKLAAVGMRATVVIAALAGAVLGIVALVQSDAGSLPRLLQKMAEIIEGARGKLPAWVFDAVPGDPEALQAAIVGWLRENAHELRTLGGEIGHVTAHVIIGMVIGGMVSLREAQSKDDANPLARELGERVARLAEAFRRVVFAQVRISALNTVFTAIYLIGVLPLFDIHLPFAKTLVALTFVAGLLPVVGNLISNAIIVVVSLSVSLSAALASLAFLIVIHKLEYFLNARIVGAQIRASAWELLLAMLVMEAAFGLAGLVAAPIYYAYLKDELAARRLI